MELSFQGIHFFQEILRFLIDPHWSSYRGSLASGAAESESLLVNVLVSCLAVLLRGALVWYVSVIDFRIFSSTAAISSDRKVSPSLMTCGYQAGFSSFEGCLYLFQKVPISGASGME